MFRIDSGPLASWRYLFLIEGGGTVLFAIFTLWYLPRSSTEASFLSDDEKTLAFRRMQLDSSAVVNERLNIRDSLRIFKHGTSWAIIGIQICLGVPLQSVQLFLPVIIKRLGYDTVKTNLYTVAPNVSGAVMLLLLAFCSDWTRWRFPFVALGFLFTFIGMVIFVSIDVERDIDVAYFASFMMTWGTSAPSVLLDAWYNNNVASEGKRVVLTSVAVPMANLMGLVSSNIFRDQDAPKYLPALITTAAFGGAGIIFTLALGFCMMYDNSRRNRRQDTVLTAMDVPTEMLREGPGSPDFRWFY